MWTDGIRPALAAPRAGARGAGFTLLEVLAAVAVLALFYTLLASLAMKGLRAEGEAERRMRASFLADRVLGDVEAGLAAGNAPEVERSEFEEGDYTVEVETRPFDLEPLIRELRDGPAPGAAERDRGGRLALLAEGSRGRPSPLLTVAIRVHWWEGHFEQSVTRHTFAFDPGAAAPLLEPVLERLVTGHSAGSEDEDEDEDDSR